jgi:S-adenosylmethionine decarboxylase
VTVSGIEYLVEAYGCDPERLRSGAALQALLRAVVGALDLHPIGEPALHHFPGEGGVTALWMLSESHVAVHTFPEHRSLALNVFCCRPRDGDLTRALVKAVGAERVNTRVVERPYGAAPPPRPGPHADS